MKTLLSRANILFAAMCAVVIGVLFSISPEAHAGMPSGDFMPYLAIAGITLDVFNSDVFKMRSLTGALRKIPFLPQTIAAKNLFEPVPLRTEEFWIEEESGTLKLIGTTPRGAPAPKAVRDKRKARGFTTVRIAKDDVLRASELLGVRAFGSETEEMQAFAEVLKRQMALRDQYLYTHEYHLLAAMQGKMLDADGTVIYDWFTEFGITEPTALTIDISNLNTTEGSFRTFCTELRRTMRRAAKGALPANFRIGALCGDTAYDDLLELKEVRNTFLNTPAAAELRGQAPDMFQFGGVTWENYVGSDDNTEIAIADDEIKFYPIGAPGIFQLMLAPGEKFADLGSMGQEYYAEAIPDMQTDEKVDIKFRAYQMPICTRPEVLQKAVVQA